MSGLDSWGDNARGEAEIWGRASESGQVYQSGGDQHVMNVYVTAEARGQAAHDARKRADGVVQALAHAVGEWAARCAELEEQTKRAKAEGRAEAHAEFAGRLKDAELRVMQAQRMMREAEEARGKAEALLTQAQQELALQRRATERERATSVQSPSSDVVRERQETEDFSQLLEQAELQLGAVRDELRLLSDEVQSGGAEDQPTVLVGETVESGADKGGAEAVTGGGERVGATSRPAQQRPVRPRKPRTPLVRTVNVVGYLVVGLPLPIAGSAIRTMYSVKTSPAVVWSVAFDVGVVVASAVVAAALYLVLTVGLNWSEDAMFGGCIGHVVTGIGLFITGIAMDADTFPQLTEAGRLVVEYLGPL